jgi:thiamine-monophosphate kinase
VFSITIALTGDATLDAGGQPLLLRRNAARIGDLVGVTGALGASAGGLRAITDGRPPTEARRRLIARHMHPRARVDAARAAVAAGIRCGIDISDGLAQDLGHICRASNAAADLQIDRIPLDADLVAEYPADAVNTAATGGEDYELILVGSQSGITLASAALSVPLSIVGRIVAGDPRVRALDPSGAEVALSSAGWDHLKRDAST